ncbi:MAG TPA: ATP-binding cassette domain-containing protein [Dehalococcoidia bacterium]|nr:ATP-binding cassette domain-containing protein [Dehalococcoidia bacterium]
MSRIAPLGRSDTPSRAGIPAIEARRVSVHFGGLVALSDVDFAAQPGSITGLVGPNGAGKTTLFGALSGLLRPSAGEVLLRGARVTQESPQARARRGLARTFQRLELFGDLTVRQHLQLGYRARRAGSILWADLAGLGQRLVDRAEGEVVAELLADLGLRHVADVPAATLPLGTGRLVEVARALAADPRVVLLDEPSSGLDVTETSELADVLLRAKQERGVTFVLVEHNLDLVLRLSDVVYVLDFGRMIASGAPQAIASDPNVHTAYLGDTLATRVRHPDGGETSDAATISPATGRDDSIGEEGAEVRTEFPLLRIEEVSARYGKVVALDSVTLDIPEGKVLALLGANGAGKTTLARLISGLMRPASGRILFDGHDLRRMPAHRIARLGIAHVPEGRGIFPGLSVGENLTLSLRASAKTRAERRASLDRVYTFFPVLAERRRQRAGTLSGGEQQMLALARVLAVPPRLLVADELSMGLAPRLIDLVFAALEEARRSGVTVLLVEQFADRALGFADEAAILRLGRIVWQGPARQASGHVLAQYLGATFDGPGA